MVVFKFQIPIQDKFTLDLPIDCSILHVDSQGDQSFVWVLCDPNAGHEERTFLLTGTGHARPDIDGFSTYIGTWQLRDLSLVFHLFEQEQTIVDDLEQVDVT